MSFQASQVLVSNDEARCPLSCNRSYPVRLSTSGNLCTVWSKRLLLELMLN